MKARPATPPPSRPSSPSRRVWIEAHGCQMNVHDAERMNDALAAEGWTQAARAHEADMIVVAGCHIRARANAKAWGRLADLRARARRAGAKPLMAMAGCVAQAEGAEALARGADVVLGAQAVHRAGALAARGGGVALALDAQAKFRALPAPRAPRVSAFLTIQEGCDKFCSFCVVPYTRGREVFRPAAAVLAEARALVDAGAREVVLLGQNVNAWRGEDARGRKRGLGWLIRALARVEGLGRIRYTTSHPRDVDDELLEAHADEPKLAPWLHLPVQSGSDAMLAAMNRRHSADAYRAIIARAREARPDIAVSSDFIVGYPGETDADFAQTLRLMKDIGFAHGYVFRHSPRPGAPSARAEPLAPEVVAARHAEALACGDAMRATRLAALAGTRARALATGAAPGKEPGWLIGRTQWMDNVRWRAPASVRDAFAEVEIVAASPRGLEGRLVAENAVGAGDARG